jgi:hypothetical protein
MCRPSHRISEGVNLHICVPPRDIKQGLINVTADTILHFALRFGQPVTNKLQSRTYGFNRPRIVRGASEPRDWSE